MVVDGVENQHSAIRRLASHAPLMEKIDRVTFDIGASSDLMVTTDLRMSLLVDLAADFVHLRDRVLIQNVSKIIDVVCSFELSDRLGVRG